MCRDPSRENSQSSTDTATSTENTPSTQSTPEVKVKQEPGDVIENGKVISIMMRITMYNCMNKMPSAHDLIFCRI